MFTSAELSQQTQICELVASGVPLTQSQEHGLPERTTIWRWASKDPDGFGKQLQSARQTFYGTLQDQYAELLQKLDNCKREDVPALQTKLNGLQWMMEKRLRTLYGAQPATLVQNNVMNVVCDEKTRKSLIEQRERLLTAGRPKDAAQRNVSAIEAIVAEDVTDL